MGRFSYRLLAGFAALFAVSHARAEPMEIIVNGQPRTALIERSTASSATPQPTIVMLHESGGQAAALAINSRLPQLVSKEGFVAVFPQGLQGQWNVLQPTNGGAPDDVGFLKTLVAQLVKSHISDPERVYLAGVSLGGFMVLRMICLDSEPFAGVALFTAAMPDVLGAKCRPTKAVPFLLMNGTADRNVPYEGGPLGNISVWSAERLLTFFRQRNGCANTGKKSVVLQPQRIEIEHATTCSGAPVINYRIVGGEHSVPWAMDVGRLLWLFFTGKLAT
jgi:polyhydroxybutyrate depolymerase